MLLSLVLALASPVQITVGPTGTGAQFTSIQDAIDFAPPGERILVAPGVYDAFSLAKPLDIIGSGSSQTIVNGGTVPNPSTGQPLALEIHSIPAGTRAALSGIGFEGIEISYFSPFGYVGPDTPLMVARDCAGALSFSDIAAAWQLNPGENLLRLERLEWVALDNCSFDTRFSQGHSGIKIDDSTVWISNSAIVDQAPNPGFGISLEVSNSGLFLSDVDIKGSDTGGCTLAGCTGFGGIDVVCFGSPAPVQLVASQLVAHAGPSAAIVPGGVGSCAWGSCDCFFGASYSISLDATSTAQVDPGIALGGSILEALAGSAQIFSTSRPNLSAASSSIQGGLTLDLTAIGEPGLAFRLFAGSPGTSLSPLPGVFGSLGLEPGLFLPIGTQLISPSGQANFSVSTPAIPAFEGVQLMFQGVLFDAPLVTSNVTFVALDA